jgi:hypothetical protein
LKLNRRELIRGMSHLPLEVSTPNWSGLAAAVAALEYISDTESAFPRTHTAFTCPPSIRNTVPVIQRAPGDTMNASLGTSPLNLPGDLGEFLSLSGDKHE